jgi:hypothetical protein
MGSAVKHLRSGNRVSIGTGRTRKVQSPIDKAKGYEIAWPQVSPLFEAARGITAISFVYFIGEADQGPLKIGVSKDPIARLRTMQTGNPRRLRIEQLLAGDTQIEKLLHELWEPHAIYSARTAGRPDAAPGTEWFKPEARPELLPIIATAAERQIEYLAAATDIVASSDLERIVRDAHAEHDFDAQGRDEVRLLATGAGHVLRSRPSRL